MRLQSYSGFYVTSRGTNQLRLCGKQLRGRLAEAKFQQGGPYIQVVTEVLEFCRTEAAAMWHD
jgi:hypothetical protein